MNNVKQSFGIRDLENLTGIKAHTIRIWEKRYNLLEPERTDTNIRTYSLKSLQKLLNIVFLYNNGHKISKIAAIPEADIPQKVREIVAVNSKKSHAINSLKISMINFDQSLFEKTFNSLRAEQDFSTIFWEVFIPLLEELGLLWQTDTIGAAHEHFITHLIKQKIVSNTEKLREVEPTKDDHIFVLFLPENEIHEIGLLFVNYELILRGYQTIYLGQTIPLDSLIDLQKYFDRLTYLSYFTVSPEPGKVLNYMEDFRDKIAGPELNGSQLWLLGRQIYEMKDDEYPENVKGFKSIEELLKSL